MATEPKPATPAVVVDLGKEAYGKWKLFLETRPANSALKIPNLLKQKYASSGAYYVLPATWIQLHCETDGIVTFFEAAERVVRNTEQWEFFSFKCRNCGTRVKTFAVLILSPGDGPDVEVMKLGEFPPFSAPISKRVQKLLGEADLETYRKGTRAEAQGLGVGAASYFRRVVESQWQLLVKEIRDAAKKLGVADLSIYDAALKETQFSAAVKLLKDAIPPKLLILGGENPLTLLYQPLSEGLHALSDEECLQQAADIRTVLTALLENIADVLKDQDELKNAAARLKQPKK
jgi:hypothetical protein